MPIRLPQNSARTLAERLRYFQRREFSLRQTLEGQFRGFFESFRSELDRAFYSYFVVPYPKLPVGQTPAWEPVEAATRQIQQALTTQFFEGLEAVQADAEDSMDDEFIAGYDTGYQQALWELYLGGYNTAGLGDPDEALGALTAAAVGGVPYPERLASWVQRGQLDVSKALATSMRGGFTLDDTHSLLDAATQRVTRGVLGLGGDELFRAVLLGAGLAYTRAGAAVVWVTADDELVCPICRPLHLTITTKQPIRDSHPMCRCWLVPLVRAGRAFIPFDEFVTE